MAKSLVKARRLFIGQDAGDRATEVTTSAAYLNKLTTGDFVGNVTGDVTGDLDGDIATTALSATHGDGATGTAATTVTHRHTVDGTIITTVKVDVTGMHSEGDADDCIGVAGSDPAYLLQYTVADMGILYKFEMICLETPATGDDDIDLRSGADADKTESDDLSGYTAVHANAGGWVGGTRAVDNAPGITADHYVYLAVGNGDTAGTYTAGMFVIKFYGHAALA